MTEKFHGGLNGLGRPLFVLLLAAAAVLPGCSGCSREKTEEQPIVDRMADPVYKAELKKQRDDQKEIVKKRNQVLRELEAAREENPESEKVKELERKEAELSAELEKNRILSMAIIRERIQKETEDRAKAKGK